MPLQLCKYKKFNTFLKSVIRHVIIAQTNPMADLKQLETHVFQRGEFHDAFTEQFLVPLHVVLTANTHTTIDADPVADDPRRYGVVTASTLPEIRNKGKSSPPPGFTRQEKAFLGIMQVFIEVKSYAQKIMNLGHTCEPGIRRRFEQEEQIQAEPSFVGRLATMPFLGASNDGIIPTKQGAYLRHPLEIKCKSCMKLPKWLEKCSALNMRATKQEIVEDYKLQCWQEAVVAHADHTTLVVGIAESAEHRSSVPIVKVFLELDRRAYISEVVEPALRFYDNYLAWFYEDDDESCIKARACLQKYQRYITQQIATEDRWRNKVTERRIRAQEYIDIEAVLNTRAPRAICDYMKQLRRILGRPRLGHTTAPDPAILARATESQHVPISTRVVARLMLTSDEYKRELATVKIPTAPDIKTHVDDPDRTPSVSPRMRDEEPSSPVLVPSEHKMAEPMPVELARSRSRSPVLVGPSDQKLTVSREHITHDSRPRVRIQTPDGKTNEFTMNDVDLAASRPANQLSREDEYRLRVFTSLVVPSSSHRSLDEVREAYARFCRDDSDVLFQNTETPYASVVYNNNTLTLLLR